MGHRNDPRGGSRSDACARDRRRAQLPHRRPASRWLRAATAPEDAAAGTHRSTFPQVTRYGGGACESNTPGRLFTPHDGFEDRGSHQAPSASSEPFCGRLSGVSNHAGPHRDMWRGQGIYFGRCSGSPHAGAFEGARPGRRAGREASMGSFVGRGRRRSRRTGIAYLLLHGIFALIALLLFILNVWMLIDCAGRQEYEFLAAPAAARRCGLVLLIAGLVVGFWLDRRDCLLLQGAQGYRQRHNGALRHRSSAHLRLPAYQRRRPTCLRLLRRTSRRPHLPRTRLRLRRSAAA